MSNGLGYIHPIEYKSAIKRTTVWVNTIAWMNLKGILLSPKSNPRKLLVLDSIYKSFSNDKKYRDENQITVSQALK